ncbi:hypothetical protein KAT92_02975 [Candidatus Babeliales bacterium]|nr:hypothetical protein [Candidatus Babeliales bacterium]
MPLFNFLTQAKQPSFWEENRLICFQGSENSPLFFQYLFAFLKEHKIVEVLPLRVESQAKLWQSLEQSFLGEQAFYWLGDVHQAFKKKKKNEPEVLDVLSLYRGPHSVAFFLSHDYKLSVSSQKRMHVIKLPEKIGRHEVAKLFAFFGQALSGPKSILVKEIVDTAGAIGLDSALMLMNYLTVTNARNLDALKTQLTKIIEPELSLAALSQAFFAKREKQFFSLWARCHNDFTIPFWIAYWSEQVWRAYHATTFLKHGNFAAARRFSFRLSSSFFKQDWRRCSPDELKQACAAIYDIDFAFKTGSTFCSFDLFYTKYFLGKFS